MQWLFDLITNPYLLTSVASWFMAQVLKTIINAVINKKINWERPQPLPITIQRYINSATRQ